MSGFLLWQSVHCEFYFSDVDWPEFRKVDFLRAVRSFQQRRAQKPKTFAGPVVHVRSKFIIESRRLVGDELNRTRLLRSQEERDASE